MRNLLLGLAIALGLALPAAAQQSITVKNATVTSLGGGGTKCVHTDNTGKLGVAAADCGSGGGSPGGSSGNIQTNNGAGGFNGLSMSADQIPVGATPTATSLPNCTDSGGNHLNYTTATHLFSCGTSSSGGGGGGLSSSETQTANNTSTNLDFTTCVDGSVSDYRFEIRGLVFATSTANLNMRVMTTGGHTVDTGNNYEWDHHGLTTGNTADNAAGSSVAFNTLARSVGTTAGFAVDIYGLIWHNFNSTTLRKHYTGLASYETSAPAHTDVKLGGDWLTTGTAVTGVRFFSDSGNLVSGSIACYRDPN